MHYSHTARCHATILWHPQHIICPRRQWNGTLYINCIKGVNLHLLIIAAISIEVKIIPLNLRPVATRNCLNFIMLNDNEVNNTLNRTSTETPNGHMTFIARYHVICLSDCVSWSLLVHHSVSSQLSECHRELPQRLCWRIGLYGSCRAAAIGYYHPIVYEY